MNSTELRKLFIDFFLKKEHEFVRSSSVAPNDDPTLLFTNAGMNQFKSIFLDGSSQNSKMKRAVNSQKCIRVSGKHNDLEEVGIDNFHHTFFEMLGSWSFGDYYKQEAIEWAWEFLTDELKLDKKRLWITVHDSDDEAEKIWREFTDINDDRVIRFGDKDNFWEMGDVGPCGPCSEIHYYIGNNINNQNSKGVNDSDEYREIWNLVFIQYNRTEDGKVSELPTKHIDTGMGFERLLAIMNEVDSNYDTDLFLPIINKIVEISGKDYSFNEGIPHRVIADHLRMLSFSIADGAMPSNDGRGYVLRRVLRRASRYGRTLDLNEPFIYKIVSVLVDIMSDDFPEVKEKEEHIKNVIKSEEESFGKTLDKGLEHFNKMKKNDSSSGIISGESAFKLYDTYGFPFDLTRLMAKELDLDIDEQGFNGCMEKQKQRGRESGKFKNSATLGDWSVVKDSLGSVFIGYSHIEVQAELLKYRSENNNYELVFNKTPFYSESGGQVGDIGLIYNDNVKFSVLDTQKNGDDIIHYCKLVSGEILDEKNIMNLEVDSVNRNLLKNNHTATHLLHATLKLVLGNHIQQAGSLVSSDKLRFDLTHYEKLTKEQISKIENQINLIIRKNIKLETQEKEYEEARQSGAEAIFDEKYGDVVRVVQIDEYSKELCGGTHANRTGDIGLFKIISEGSLSTGVRRIEAVTGEFALNRMVDYEEQIKNIATVLKCSEEEMLDKISSIIALNKENQKLIDKYNDKNQSILAKELYRNSSEINGVKIIVEFVGDCYDIKGLGEKIRNLSNDNDMIALVSSIVNDKPIVMCTVSDSSISYISSKDVVTFASKFIDGGGGGKPQLSTAGGKNKEGIKELMAETKNYILKVIDEK